MFGKENLTQPVVRQIEQHRRSLADISNAQRNLPLSAFDNTSVEIVRKPRARNGVKAATASSRSCAPRSLPTRDNISVSRRNERERNRVKLLNLGFQRLRSVVPSHSGEQLSKISTLKKAIWYIEHLDRVLHGQTKSSRNNQATSRISASNSAKTERQSQKTVPVSTNSEGRGQSKEVAGTAFRKASWSSLENSSGACTNSAGRPAEHNLPSPIFPTNYGFASGYEVTVSSSKAVDQTFVSHKLQSSPSGSSVPQDSGYGSTIWGNASLTPNQGDPLNGRGTILQQRFLNSLGSFSQIMPNSLNVTDQAIGTFSRYSPSETLFSNYR